MSRLVLIAASLVVLGCDGAGAEPPVLAPDAGPPRVHHREPDLGTMVPIAAGTFRMGHPVERPGAYGQAWKENELPEHPVTLAAFHLDATEVTVSAYAEFLGEAGGDVHRHARMPIERTAEGYAPVAGAADRPIALVSWYDAVTFCAWAGKRLPTEAEWEKAARGEDGRTFPWGEDRPTMGRLNFADSLKAVARIGSYPAGAGPYGVEDMAGNVAEWVDNWYDPKVYTSDGVVQNPRGPATGRMKVVRGGSWQSREYAVRASARVAKRPTERSATVGFRCAMTPVAVR